MKNTTGKVGTVLAAAALGFGLPAAAMAQDYPTGMQDGVLDSVVADQGDASTADVAVIDRAMAGTSASAKALTDLGEVSSADVAVVSMNDMNLTAEQRYAIAQNSDPGIAAMLQNALAQVTVGEFGGDTPTLADHLRSVGVDPASVVAVNVDSDNAVTVYTQ